jgi:segregation and condensation protein B
MNDWTNEYLKGVIEALLFINERPVTIDQIQEVVESVGKGDIKRFIYELQEEYEHKKRGVVIIEVAGGFQMLSNPDYASYVRAFFKTRVKEKLSRPALEALAIIAYKQPVSRGDIELIRGVNSDGIVAHLLTKGLVKIAGRKEIPGRPYVYGTTKLFLEYFGLNALSDLPKLEEFPSLIGNVDLSTLTVRLPEETANVATDSTTGEAEVLSEQKLQEETHEQIAGESPSVSASS